MDPTSPWENWRRTSAMMILFPRASTVHSGHPRASRIHSRFPSCWPIPVQRRQRRKKSSSKHSWKIPSPVVPELPRLGGSKSDGLVIWLVSSFIPVTAWKAIIATETEFLSYGTTLVAIVPTPSVPSGPPWATFNSTFRQTLVNFPDHFNFVRSTLWSGQQMKFILTNLRF